MSPDQRAVLLAGLTTVISWLEENAPRLPSLPDVADADMALMHLRHAVRHIQGETS